MNLTKCFKYYLTISNVIEPLFDNKKANLTRSYYKMGSDSV